MNHTTITKLAAIANFCDEAVSSLENGGVEPLVLQTWLAGVGPLAKDLQAAAQPAASAPAGQFSGTRAPKTPAAQKTAPAVQSGVKSAPPAKPAPVPAPKTGTVSIPASKTETLRPPARKKVAGM